MKISTINNKLIPFFSAFCVIWLHNSYFMQANMPGIFRTILPFIFAVIIMVILRMFAISKTKLIFALVVFGLVLLSNRTYLNCEIIVTNFLIIFGGMLLSNLCTFNEFVKSYNKVIFWICIISIILYFINLISPTLLKLIPNFLCIDTFRGSDLSYGRLYFYTFFVGKVSNYYRNFGIFVEPGMFQIYINFALMLELFYSKKSETVHIIAYLFAISTCLSTTGIVVSAILLLCYLLDRDSYLSSERKRNLYVILFIVVTVFAIGPSIGIDILGILEKLTQLKDNVSYGNISSGAERTRAFSVALQAFFERPLFGFGNQLGDYARYKAGKKIIMTATCINWFARGGFLNGVIWNFSYFQIVRYFKKNICITCILIVCLFLLISTQAMEANLFIVTICFWGISYKGQGIEFQEDNNWEK